jgi:hypothetical protein
MTPLVTIADLAAYKHIADSVKNSIVWPQFVIEAQLFDVKAWLGDALLAEIMDEAQTSPPSLSDKNKALLDGGKYTYSNRTAYFQGLRACIMYYAFGRYTSRQPFNYTAAGITVKDTDFSTPASDKAVQRLATEATLMGASIKDEIVLYLRRNSKDYPLLKCTRTGGQARTFNVIGD